MTARRDVLRSLALPVAGSLLPADWLAWGREVHAATDAGRLGDAARRVLAAVCERIIPSDETPGAVAAGVPAFVDRMLSDWYDEADRALVLTGIESLDAEGRSRHGHAFADVSAAEQDALLLELDGHGASHWFATLKFLTIWGYCTSEVGITQELGLPEMGAYDGCAPYTPRRRGRTP